MMRGWQLYLGTCVIGVSPLLSLREIAAAFCLIGAADSLSRIRRARVRRRRPEVDYSTWAAKGRGYR